jgi:hypothetical protein
MPENQELTPYEKDLELLRSLHASGEIDADEANRRKSRLDLLHLGGSESEASDEIFGEVEGSVGHFVHNRFSVAGFLLVVAAWLMWFQLASSEDMGFDARLMLGSNLLGFVSAVIGLQQSNRERNQNEASFDPRSRTFAKMTLVLAIPGLLLLGLLLTLCGDPNVNC